MDDDEAEQIVYWEEKLEELKTGYDRVLSHRNPIYEKQLAELERVTEQKRATLNKWRADKLASIHNEKVKKVALLQSECERHKRDIPKLLERSIRQQFSQLQKEFACVFDCFLDRDIPFIEEFAHHRFSRVCTLTSNRQFCSSQEVRQDFERIGDVGAACEVRPGEIVARVRVYRPGDNIVVAFGQMRPIDATITSIDGSVIVFLPKNAATVVRIPVEAIELGVVTISHQ
jgi:hypothetical protein